MKDSNFSEDQAKQILARAAELDSRAAVSYSRAELERIAADAMIAAPAIERALDEALSQPGVTARRSTTARGDLLNAVGFLGLGAGLGVMAVVADAASFGPESAAAVFGPSAAFVLYRALRNRWDGSPSKLLRELTLTLGSFTLAATAVQGLQATGPALLWSFGCLMAGSVVGATDVKRTLTAVFSDAQEVGQGPGSSPARG